MTADRQAARFPLAGMSGPQLAGFLLAVFVTGIFVFDPVGYFGLRPIALVLSVAIGFPMLLLSGRRVNGLPFLVLTVYGLLLPVWGLLGYGVSSTAELTDTSYVSFALLLGMAGFYAHDGDQRAARATTLVASLLISAVVYGSFVYILLTGVMDALSTLTTSSIAVLGFRQYAGVQTPYIFVLASPILMLGASLLVFDGTGSRRRDAVLFLLFMSALALSGTRAHQAIAALFLGLFLFRRVGRLAGLGYVALLVMAGLLVLAPILAQALDPNETNNAHKLGMFEVYREIFNDPRVLLVGQGFNAHSWSADLRTIVSLEIGATRTELTFLEMVRVFGIPVGGGSIALLLVFILRPVHPDVRVLWLRVGLIFQLLNSILNPYLFSFNGAFGLAMLIGLSWRSRADTRQVPARPGALAAAP